MRILSEYSTSSAVKHIKRNHMKKLSSVLSKPQYKGITTDDFLNYAFVDQKTGKSLVSYEKKDKIREMISNEFQKEFNAIGAKIEKYSARNLFVKQIASDENTIIDLKAKGMSDEQIKTMKEKGVTPNGYTVHHKFPRFFTEKLGIKHNHPSNLLLVKEGEESGDDFFHAFMDKQINEAKAKVEPKANRDSDRPFNEHDFGIYLKNNNKTMTMYIAWPVGPVYLTDKNIEKKAELLKQVGKEHKPLSSEELLSKAIKEASDVSADIKQRTQNNDFEPSKIGVFSNYDEIKKDKFDTKEKTAMRYAIERAKNNQGR
ncbi:MAG: hypothetical protein BWY78_00338 [Alphaproteobacteria bacterium ADurb.Bin438]|nr:MAG: hypothetical protein BWY78_00338 [Alphaproteobacteria bacterium ADurb.Bin438]